ncbi:MAG: lipid-A-disaccharide synthase [Chlorobi bacterium]|nr:lipid-A-disaccharide synthase [Chlorobiota bacterium]
MKYFIIAGEASGDLHGSNLIKQLKRFDNRIEIECWGGEKMEAAGAKLIKHYKEHAFMGFFVVLWNLRTLAGLFKKCKTDILNFNPDALILIDYPGFNLRIAKFAFLKKIKVFYYISPKIWAWNQKRAWKIKKYVNHMFTIFPFETEFYKKYNYPVDYVGNPLLDSIEQFKKSGESLSLKTPLKEKPLIALLPGSRKQEISNSLPVMLSMVDVFKEYQFIIAGAPGIDKHYYKEIIGNRNIDILFGKTYAILEKSTAALVTSGTATLETALFKVPQIVCYKAGYLSYKIAKKLIKVNYISLVNLVMDRSVVKELIQYDLNSEKLKTELDNILYNKDIKNKMFDDYAELEIKLGGKGASERAAKKMIEYLQLPI